MENLSDDKKVDIIKKQTAYTEDEAQTKLKEHDGNVESVILEYVGGNNVKERKMTNNQKMYKAMRELY